MYNDIESQLENIEEMFRNMSENGWNVEGDLLFGYFFFHRTEQDLKNLLHHLSAKSYELAELFEIEDGSTGKGTGRFVLHVERVETHSPESLAKRNVEFTELAVSWHIDLYDGFDVGPVGTNH